MRNFLFLVVGLVGGTGMKRKFYRITTSGKKMLEEKLTAWDSVTALIKTCQKGALN